MTAHFGTRKHRLLFHAARHLGHSMEAFFLVLILASAFLAYSPARVAGASFFTGSSAIIRPSAGVPEAHASLAFDPRHASSILQKTRPAGPPYHSFASDTHEENSDVHVANTDSHTNSSDYHYEDSDTHYAQSDYHHSNSDLHSTSSDTHLVSSDVHSDASTTHDVDSDTHEEDSDHHSEASDGHSISSTSHSSTSDAHDGLSSTHAVDSSNLTEGSGGTCRESAAIWASTRWGDPPFVYSSHNTRIDYGALVGPQGEPFNIGEVRSIFGLATFQCLEQPAASALTGTARLVVESGDPTVVQLLRGYIDGAPYQPGDPIPVHTDPHDGCRFHSHIAYTDPDYYLRWSVIPLKPGSVTFRFECVPDGVNVVQLPNTFARLVVTVPEYSETPLQVLYKVFIECEAIESPSPFFLDDANYHGGDDRTASYSEGWDFDGSVLGSRGAMELNLYGNGVVQADSPRLAWGQSQAYNDASDAVVVSAPADRPDCTWHLVDPSPDDTAQEQVSDETLSIQVTPMPPEKLGDHIWRVRLFMHGIDYNETIACAIDSEVFVDLNWYGGHWLFKANGWHDTFPSHEMFLGHHPAHIFSHQGSTVVNLCPSPFGSGVRQLVGTFIWTPVQ